MSPVRVPAWVGVKVTAISQLAPTATVPPLTQGVIFLAALTVASAKSPLGTMVLMFSAEPPVLVKVTFLAAVVLPTNIWPHVSEVGDRAGPLRLTVRLSVAVLVNVPDMPPIATVTVPVAAVALAVKVSVLVVVAGLGLNSAVTPPGKPEAERVTLPLKPSAGVMVMVLVPLLPSAMVALVGLAESVKLGPAGPVSALIRAAPFGLPHPLSKS